MHSPPLASLLLFAALVLMGGCKPEATADSPEDVTTAAAPHASNPLFKGSAEVGSGSGLAILNPIDPTRPFFNPIGVIPRGEERLWIVQLENQDREPVEIKSARGACGCMHLRAIRAIPADGGEPVKGTPHLPGSSILVADPGDVIELTIAITTERIQANKPKSAELTLSTTSDTSPYVALVTQFVALDSFTVNPRELLFQSVPQGYGKSAKVRILAEPQGSPAKILGVESQGPQIRAELEETFYGGEYVWHVLAHVDPLEPLGAIREKIVLRTTDPEGNGDEGRLEITAIATVVPDVRIYPSFLTFAAVKEGEEKALDANVEVLVPGMSMGITGHRFEGDSAEHLAFEAVENDAQRLDRVPLRVKVLPTHPVGPIVARLTVETDDAQYPTVDVAVGGAVVR